MNFEYFGMSPVYWGRKRTKMNNSLSDECLVKVILDGDDNAFTQMKGKIFLGRKDSLISEGSDHRVFASLYWRTCRVKKTALLELY